MQIDREALQRYAVENFGGFLTGSVSVLLGHPFDTIKVRLQAGRASYSSATDCFWALVRGEGPRALWKGILPPLLANSAMNAITFSTWQETQRLLHSEEGVPAPLGKVFVSGACAGTAQCSLATPVELVRTKLQVQFDGSRQYNGNIDCMRQIVRSEGLQGLYRGHASMVLREAPAFGVYFTTYEAMKRALCPGLQPGEDEPMWVQAAGGAFTGGATWAAVMPMDVISTRIKSLPEAVDPRRRSLAHVAGEIWKEAGVAGFYRGLPTAVLRGVVLNTIAFPVYEATVRHFS